jgi:hypothetical protein
LARRKSSLTVNLAESGLFVLLMACVSVVVCLAGAARRRDDCKNCRVREGALAREKGPVAAMIPGFERVSNYFIPSPLPPRRAFSLGLVWCILGCFDV